MVAGADDHLNPVSRIDAMPPEPPNPFAAPTSTPVDMLAVGAEGLPPKSLAKAEAVIKDANQFWLAILLCFLCSGLGMVIIGPWYLVRLLQWRGLARDYPQLTHANAIRTSLPSRFQSARTKLFIGLGFGVLIVLAFVALMVAAVGAASVATPPPR